MNRPTSPLSVDAYLRSLLPPDGSTQSKVLAESHGEYPYLYGAATVKLAEANRTIERLTAERDRLEGLLESLTVEGA
jgi:hypothetical protein